MKIRIEIVDDNEEEIIIKTKEIDEKILQIQNALKNITNENATLSLYKGETQFFIEIDTILFFETTEGGVCAHTARDVFDTRRKLYELEEILPSYFMRVSKSAILNTNKVYSISKNITASSIVEFAGSHKQIFVSRNYYKALINKLEEKRL